MSELFFVSDVHFGHNNIIKYCSRPFESVEAMDQSIVENWNRTVSRDDTVYHLGDWAFHNYNRIGELNGNVFSVPGNHDHERMSKVLPYLPNGFLNEVHYLKLDKERRFVLCHYPIESWRREYRYHLHGHTHGTSRQLNYRLDVGLDARPDLARPLHVDEVIQSINERLT